MLLSIIEVMRYVSNPLGGLLLAGVIGHLRAVSLS